MSSGKSGIATLLGLRGDTPEVPDFIPVDYTDEQRKAALGNLENLPEIARLGSETNEQMAAQYLELLQSMGLKGLYDQNIKNLEGMSRGELPPDVENAVKRYAAEAGAVSGTSGSQFDKFRSARNLGITSLDLTQRALSSSAQWLAQAGNRQFNFASMFQSPAQRVDLAKWNETMRWDNQWLKNQIKALPSNEEMAYAQMLDYVADFATIAASYGTSSMMGGGQQQSPPPQNPPPNYYGGGGGQGGGGASGGW